MTQLTAEAVVDWAVPRTPQVSPDGRWVVFGSATVGRHTESTLWLAPADGSASPRQLTTDNGREPRWAPDSGSVFFLSGRDQVHRVGLGGGEAEQLTDRPAGVRACVPLADPKRVVLIAPDEREPAGPRIRTVTADGTHDTGNHPDRLWLLDLATGTIEPLAAFGERHVVEAAARPDGGALAVLTWSVAEQDPGLFEPGLHVVDLTEGTVRELGVPALSASSLSWWRGESGWRLCYLGLTPPGLVGGFAVFDGQHRNLTAGMTACPTELIAADPPLALFAEGLDTAVRRLDPVTGKFAELQRFRGHLKELSGDGTTIAVVASTAAAPPTVHIGPPEGPLTRVGALPLPDIQWAGQERLAYQAEDGLELDGLLLLPPGRTRADGPFPLVTVVHGGPHDRYADGFNLGWFPSGQWLATAGFAVFLPNARGGLGHGHAFAASVAGDVGGAEFTDVLTGIDLLVADGVADPHRLGIAGWSHGGFVAAWAVTQTGRFAAALVGAGVTDWPLLAATGEHTRFEAALGGRENSPITYAGRIRTPVLILHGENDTNVPLSQAELLHRALRDREHEYVVYPRENHAIRERGHQLDVLRRTREWFSRWLTPAGGA
ncbi:prolyl oligopeptidase family serine peptidase [Amycolatopsis sp. NEAU-NG30]|uniref:Prolyl oligopeptidase family serine peptidase n=1 Tax=Amycolatopsis melonis TaxID=3156488 RepID=A0ABV0LTD5_9PSEU